MLLPSQNYIGFSVGFCTSEADDATVVGAVAELGARPDAIPLSPRPSNHCRFYECGKNSSSWLPIRSLTHSVAQSPIHNSLACSLTHLLTRRLAPAHTRSLIHSLTRSLTHRLAHSLTRPLPSPPTPLAQEWKTSLSSANTARFLLLSSTSSRNLSGFSVGLSPRGRRGHRL